MKLRANAAPSPSPTSQAPTLWRMHAAVDGDIRRETYNGREHIVAPVVALVEGVIQCATCPDPELALASEFAKVVESWNGRPVTVPHPSEGGQLVPAGAPGIMERFAIGWVFNARLEDSKLHLEAWVDPEMAANVEDGARLVERLEARENGTEERIEVSTGYFAESAPGHGTHSGRQYAAIQRDVKPDHLALLREDQQGACSWQEGCGVRSNFVGACSCGSGVNPAESCEALRRKVDATSERTARYAQPRDGQVRANATGTSYEDLRRAIALRLSDELDGDLFMVHAVFQDAVVYERWSSLKIFERAWSMEGDQIVLGEDVIEVRPETRFIPVNPAPRQNARPKEASMDRESTIKALIEGEATPWTESDRATLEALSDEQLEHLSKPAEAEPAAMDRESVETWARENGLELHDRGVQTLSDEDRAILAAARRERESRKKALVESLKGHERNPYTDDELRAMDLDALEKTARLAGLEQERPEPTYVRPVPGAAERDNEGPPAAPSGWDRPTAA